MIPLGDLLTRATLDPLVRAALLAAAVLAVSALTGGLARRDLVALRRPATWLAIASALVAALSLATAADRVVASTGGSVSSLGWERIPLYLLALGYGPSIGVVAGLLMTLTRVGPWTLGPAELTLVLELAAVGWLGLGPTPRNVRWAGPLAVGLGWTLATATLGLAVWAADGRPIALVPFVTAHAGALPAVAIAAMLAAAIPPRSWRRQIPGAADAVRMERDDERVRWLRPLQRPDRSHRRTDRSGRSWSPPPRVAPFGSRRRRRRALTPPPALLSLRRPLPPLPARPDERGSLSER